MGRDVCPAARANDRLPAKNEDRNRLGDLPPRPRHNGMYRIIRLPAGSAAKGFWPRLPFRVSGDGGIWALPPRPQLGSHAGKLDEKPHGVVVASTLPCAPSPASPLPSACEGVRDEHCRAISRTANGIPPLLATLPPCRRKPPANGDEDHVIPRRSLAASCSMWDGTGMRSAA